MGLFDTLLLEIKCPECKTIEIREVQTKDFECCLNDFKVGDVIDSTISDKKIDGATECRVCDIWIDVICNMKDSKLTNEYKITSVEKKWYFKH